VDGVDTGEMYPRSQKAWFLWYYSLIKGLGVAV